MTDELKAEREAFEKWVRANTHFDLERMVNGDYLFGSASDAWKAWQARAKLDGTYTTGGDGDE